MKDSRNKPLYDDCQKGGTGYISGIGVAPSGTAVHESNLSTGIGTLDPQFVSAGTRDVILSIRKASDDEHFIIEAGCRTLIVHDIYEAQDKLNKLFFDHYGGFFEKLSPDSHEKHLEAQAKYEKAKKEMKLK